MAVGRREDVAELPVIPGLCAHCRHLVVLRSPRSVFVRCGRAERDPAYPRYPPLPVLRCPGFEAVAPPSPSP